MQFRYRRPPRRDTHDPGGLGCPVRLASLGDRYPRKAVMITSNLIRAGLIAGAGACVFLDAPAETVYAIAGIAMIVGTPFRPALAALTPVDRPDAWRADCGQCRWLARSRASAALPAPHWPDCCWPPPARALCFS